MIEDQNEQLSPEGGKAKSPQEVNENISEEEIIEQPETEISKSEIEKMEVHHHPIQHKAGEKKNFKEYFLEFLMIFL